MTIAASASGLTPASPLFFIIKMTLLSTLQVMFSPLTLLTAILIALIVSYMICMMNNEFKDKNSKKKYIKGFIFKNKFLIIAFTGLLLILNAAHDQKAIIDGANALITPREKMCVIVTNKMLTYGLSDEEIKDDMEKSGCNPVAFPMIKLMWGMVPKVPHSHGQKHNQYNWREENAA